MKPTPISVLPFENPQGPTLGNYVCWGLRRDQEYSLWTADMDNARFGEHAALARIQFSGSLKATREIFRPFSHEIHYETSGGCVTQTFFVPVGGEMSYVTAAILLLDNRSSEPFTLTLVIQLGGRLLGFGNGLLQAEIMGKQTNLEIHGGTCRTEGETCFLEVLPGQGASVVVCTAPRRSRRLAYYLASSEQAYQALCAFEQTFFAKTPEHENPRVREAAAWARANVQRCVKRYPLGWGMTNCPPSAIVVGRDTAWMAIGCDLFLPDLAREMLFVFREYQYTSGKIPEYVNLVTGQVEDYGLNLSDNTPLYLWAVWHHWKASKDEKFRSDFRESVASAANYLLSQRNRRNLVYGIPAGTATRGICSWRNIIEGYVLAGEVTEINSETVLALRVSGEFLDDPEMVRESSALAKAIESSLQTQTGYLLTRFEGKEVDELTCDLLFPSLCRVSSKEKSLQVLHRLAESDFWGPCGLRAVPKGEAQYDPVGSYGLLGGCWPNPTLWLARAARDLMPELAERCLESVIEKVLNPKGSDRCVPGEFGEYFHGEGETNLGMPLSPWVAPTFLWAIEPNLV